MKPSRIIVWTVWALWISFVLYVSISCNSMKKTTKYKEDTATKSTIQSNKTIDNTINTTIVDKSIKKGSIDSLSNLESIDKSIGEYESHTLVYDTSKPIDAKTGKPPLLSEKIIKFKKSNDKKTTQTSSKNENVIQQNDLKVDQNSNTKIVSDSSVKTDSKNKIVSEFKKKRNPNLYFILISIIVFIIVFLVVKRVPVVAFFGKILNIFGNSS